MKTDRLSTIVDRRLSAVSFGGEHAVLRAVLAGPQRMPATRRRFRLALILVLALIALLGTALALGLIYSSGYSARKAADAALMEKYGFRQETMGMFLVKESGEGGRTRFTYTSHMYNEKAGTYTVDIDEHGEAQASWSLDSADPVQFGGGSLEAPLWDARQLNAYLRLKNAYYRKAGELDWSQADTWSLEERAEIYALLDGMQAAYGETPLETHIVPGADDLSEEEAVRLARAALVQTYGLPDSRFEAFRAGCAFTLRQEDQTRRYTVTFHNRTGPRDPFQAGYESFQVRIHSPSGRAEQPVWFIRDLDKRSLPAGDLTAYPHAVREYMDSGAFDALSAAEKGRLAQRLVRGGYAWLLKDVRYIIPGPGLIPETEALEKADRVLFDRYRLTRDMLTLFERSISLQRLDNHAVWLVRYTARSFRHMNVVVMPPLGDYTVRLLAGDGQLTAASWSLEGVETRRFTRHTWGEARAYDADILPWLLQMFAAQERLLSEYDDDAPVMSLEDKAAYDALCRENGFDKNRYPSDLPRDDELTREAALAIALSALREELHLGEEVISQFTLMEPDFLRYAGYMRARSQDPLWLFRFHNQEGIYLVFLSAVNGELILVEYEPAAAGNG